MQVPATGAQMAASLSPVASPGQGAARQTAGDQTNPLIDPSYRGAAEPTSSASAGATWMYGSLGAVASMLGLMVLIIFLTGGSSRSRVITGGPRANSAANVPETKTPATASTAGASGAPSGSAGSSGEDVAKPTAVESATDSSTRVDPPTPTGSGDLTPAAADKPKPQGPAIPDVVADLAAKGRIPADVIEKAFGGRPAAAAPSGDSSSAATGGVWNVEPDPPVLPVEYKSGRLSVTIPDGAEVVFPRAESNFVVAQLDSLGNHAIQAIDLREAKFVGRPVTDEIRYDLEASADGKYIAARKQAGTSSYGVWSLETGSLLNDFSFTSSQDVDAVRFGAPDRLVFVNEPSSSAPLKIKIGSGGMHGEFSIPADREHPIVKNSFTVSHAGAYAALVRGPMLTIISLEDGEVIGETLMATQPKECVGTAFSPDGKELAALFNFDNGSHLIIWDMETGRPLVDAEYDQQISTFFPLTTRLCSLGRQISPPS